MQVDHPAGDKAEREVGQRNRRSLGRRQVSAGRDRRARGRAGRNIPRPRSAPAPRAQEPACRDGPAKGSSHRRADVPAGRERVEVKVLVMARHGGSPLAWRWWPPRSLAPGMAWFQVGLRASPSGSSCGPPQRACRPRRRRLILSSSSSVTSVVERVAGMPAKRSEGSELTLTRSDLILAIGIGIRRLPPEFERDLEIAHQLFGGVDPHVRDAADELVVAGLHRQAARIAPGRDGEAAGTGDRHDLVVAVAVQFRDVAARAPMRRGRRRRASGRRSGACGKPSDTAVRASATSRGLAPRSVRGRSLRRGRRAAGRSSASAAGRGPGSGRSRHPRFPAGSPRACSRSAGSRSGRRRSPRRPRSRASARSKFPKK